VNNVQKIQFYPLKVAPTKLPVLATNSSIKNDSVLDVGFLIRRLTDDILLGISASGDHAFLTDPEIDLLRTDPATLPLSRRAALQARFFIPSFSGAGSARLLKSRQEAKRSTIHEGPALHIIVPTLQCAHSCKYCQVSRSLQDDGHTMSIPHLDAACDSIFESPAQTLTIEFQGGDPLLRFDLVQHAIERIVKRNQIERRSIRFVVASTLHQLNIEMCRFLKLHGVFLSTSIDGPSFLHNKNRPTPCRDAYERTVTGIELARSYIGREYVSALMTTTRESLAFPEEIVDEYVKLGLADIFLRPLSSYGFAKRNQLRMAYSLSEFCGFYLRALERIFYWNQQGVSLREVYTSIILNKMLSTFDGGYVDLQSPTGAGTSVLVYNYDGYVYPSDEARMLAETGDVSLRLGAIGEALANFSQSPLQQQLTGASLVQETEGCKRCTYNQFCSPNPVDALAQHGTLFAPVLSTEHCQRHMWLFDTMFIKLKNADAEKLELFYRWAQPSGQGEFQ
jgi:His-Xaa-Ser system radical SAM maturase HxsB